MCLILTPSVVVTYVEAIFFRVFIHMYLFIGD